MKSLSLVRWLYSIASLYEMVLGLAFLVAAPQIFRAAAIAPPNHWGYVHFAAGLLVVFGLMFLAIARQPIENRNLVVYGILLKLCYVITVCYHWYAGGVPGMWKYFAGVDALFAIAFFWSLVPLEMAALEKKETERDAAVHV